MEKELVNKLQKEIKFVNDQFDFLYNEHFIGERCEDSFYDEMIKKVTKSKGKIELIIELLNK